MTSAGDWCTRCRHMIVRGDRPGTWVHVSDDDWSRPALAGNPDCPCAYTLAPCEPQSWPSRAIADLAEGFRVIARSARYSSASYTGLAAALELEQQEDQP